MHMQLAERRVTVEHLQRRILVEVPLELLRRDVLDGVAPPLAEQAAAGELGEGDGHGANYASHSAFRGIRMTSGVLGASTRMASRSEEHTSELQSLMRISYAVFCLKKKNQ